MCWLHFILGLVIGINLGVLLLGLIIGAKND